MQSQKAIALESFIKNPYSNIPIYELRPESLEILLECSLNQLRVACDLVTNFGVALMKKLWQCSVLSSTLRVAVGKTENPQTAMHTKTEKLKFFGTKNRKTGPKK